MVSSGNIKIILNKNIASTQENRVSVEKAEVLSDYPPEPVDITVSQGSNYFDVSISQSELTDNCVFIVTIDSTLSSEDGDNLLNDYVFSYTGNLSPYFTSSKMIRLKAGTVLTEISDISIALNIHIASIEANNKIPSHIPSKIRAILKEKYVFYTAMEGILTNNYSFGLSDYIKKQLGDFSMAVSTKTKVNLYNKLLDQAGEWKRIFNIHVSSFSKSYFLKQTGYGNIGRLWASGKRFPGLNTKKPLSNGLENLLTWGDSYIEV